MNMCPVELSNQSDHVILMEGAEGGPAGLEMLEGCHDIGLSNFDTLRNRKIPDFYCEVNIKAVCSEQQRLS